VAGTPAPVDPAPVAVVTGGSGGIGFACGQLLAKRGYDVVLTARREAPLREAAEALGCRWKTADCSVEADVDALYDGESAIAVVVHAAGLYEGTLVKRQGVDVVDRVLAANLRSAYLVASKALPLMSAGARIIFISSIASRGQPTLSAYSMSKAGENALAISLAGEVEKHGIGVHLVTPGPVDTPMFGDYVANVPTIRADDVARAVGWLEEMPSHVVLREIVLEPATSGPFVLKPEGSSDA
jgi:NAD(P)-dependent dehydrogenase (short-subunit alcohol dehydrogenase family)